MRNGKPIEEMLRVHHVSHEDLVEDLRLKTQATKMEDIKEARLERNGDVSFILCPKSKAARGEPCGIVFTNGP